MTPYPSSPETDAAASRGSDLSFEERGLHAIRLTARHARAALAAVDHAVAAAGAEVRQLSLSSIEGRAVAEVRLAAVSAPAARRIGDGIAAAVGVESVTVEHVWGRM